MSILSQKPCIPIITQVLKLGSVLSTPFQVIFPAHLHVSILALFATEMITQMIECYQYLKRCLSYLSDETFRNDFKKEIEYQLN